MMPLHSILASDMIATFAKLCQVLFLASLVLAFVMGFYKGFRRVNWSGLIWLSASVLFIVICKADSAVIMGWAGVFKMLLLAVFCVLVSMVLYACLAGFVRPKMRWVKDNVNGDTSLAEYGLEFEPEYLDYDGEDDWKPYGKRLQKIGFAPPSFWGRFFGGLTCMVNVGMTNIACNAFLIFCIEFSGIQSATLNNILTHESIASLVNFVNSYMLDVLAVGFIFLLAKWGMNKGFTESFSRALVLGGGLLAFVLCFWLPFSSFATAESGVFRHLAEFVNRCSNVFVGFGRFSAILGKLFAGGLMFVLALIFLWAFNMAIKKCCKIVAKMKVMRVVDACLASFVYAMIAAAFCGVIFFALAGFDYFNVFEIGSILGRTSELSTTLFDVAFNKISSIMAHHIG